MRPNQVCQCHVMLLMSNGLSEPQGTCAPSICFESCPLHGDALSKPLPVADTYYSDSINRLILELLSHVTAH
jgi:hypothetical protein